MLQPCSHPITNGMSLSVARVSRQPEGVPFRFVIVPLVQSTMQRLDMLRTGSGGQITEREGELGRIVREQLVEVCRDLV